MYVVILRLTDERVPPEINKLSQQELTYIAEFLRGFDNTEADNCSGRKGVNLEKLGQYLRREPLQNCLKSEGSEWASLLNENLCLHNHSLIIKQDLDSSLLQSHDNVVEAINLLFAKSYQGLTDYFLISHVAIDHVLNYQSFSQIVNTDDHLFVAINDKERKIVHIFMINRHENEEQNLSFKKISIDIDEDQGII